ncbi:hypothetical protein, partial [Yoonia sp. R2-816]|uniref:hypothetical protein n=1 Tax=Yoonia sp. R2-816 TaxID=3342638 RepID=UPI0037262A1D
EHDNHRFDTHVSSAMHRLQILTIPRQRGSLIVPGKSKTLMRRYDPAPTGTDPLMVEAFGLTDMKALRLSDVFRIYMRRAM